MGLHTHPLPTYVLSINTSSPLVEGHDRREHRAAHLGRPVLQVVRSILVHKVRVILELTLIDFNILHFGREGALCIKRVMA